MIKTIVFDFGGVLVRNTTQTLEKFYRYDKLKPGQQKEYDRAVHLSETGKITFKELFDEIHKLLAKQLTARQVEQFLLDKAKVLPAWKLAKQLDKRYRVIIFSNNFKMWPQTMGKKLGIDVNSFPFVDSAYIGMRKPDIRFYRYLLKRFRLKPEETVFIDDQPHNLVPAKKLGIHTFHYRSNQAALKKYFKKIGVTC